MYRLAIALFAIALGCSACSTRQDLRAGMSRAEVEAALGPPLERKTVTGGGEAWSYKTLAKRRVAEPYNNLERQGESVFERDLRIDTGGYVGGVEFATYESEGDPEELRFNAAGRLIAPPDAELIPNRE